MMAVHPIHVRTALHLLSECIRSTFKVSQCGIGGHLQPRVYMCQLRTILLLCMDFIL